ncbi:MAG: CPBP family intramembrane metalloprotease [Anaerolineae bacterium]|nr:CPBP family intramembrane metalloprotease [Anaerolineae bacterium]
MSVIRNDAGGIRLVWRLILVILLYVAVAVLLRFIPIRLLTASLVRDGMAQGSALERANTIILKDPIWSIVIGTISGLMGLLVVWFLVHVVERSKFTWKTVGLDWRGNSPLLILVGTVLAFLLFIAYMLIGYLLGSSGSSLSASLMGVGIAIFFQKFILYIGMGFGEEVVFRGYVQTRAVARLGVVWGILVTAVVFILLHQISYNISLVTALSGTMLWITIGALYHLSKSLYLVGMFHGVMNILLNTLSFDVTDVGGMVVHALALLILIVIASLAMRQHHLRSSPA